MEAKKRGLFDQQHDGGTAEASGMLALLIHGIEDRRGGSDE